MIMHIILLKRANVNSRDDIIMRNNNVFMNHKMNIIDSLRTFDLFKFN